MKMINRERISRFMLMQLYLIHHILSHREPSDKETDSRYAEYGLAPKGKADYAFCFIDLLSY